MLLLVAIPRRIVQWRISLHGRIFAKVFRSRPYHQTSLQSAVFCKFPIGRLWNARRCTAQRLRVNPPCWTIEEQLGVITIAMGNDKEDFAEPFEHLGLEGQTHSELRKE